MKAEPSECLHHLEKVAQACVFLFLFRVGTSGEGLAGNLSQRRDYFLHSYVREEVSPQCVFLVEPPGSYLFFL